MELLFNCGIYGLLVLLQFPLKHCPTVCYYCNVFNTLVKLCYVMLYYIFACLCFVFSCFCLLIGNVFINVFDLFCFDLFVIGSE